MIKSIITSIAILMATAATAQQWENKQDSLDFHSCKRILSDLFNGNLYKDGKIQSTHDADYYPWRKGDCPGTLESCPRFSDTYKNYFTKDLRENINRSGIQYWHNDDRTEFTISYQYVIVDGYRAGETEMGTFRFTKGKNDAIYLVQIK